LLEGSAKINLLQIVLIVNGNLSTICLIIGSSNKSGSLVLGCGLIAGLLALKKEKNQ
jgi:hypothetical protein